MVPDPRWLGLNERQSEIVRLVREAGFASIKSLARRFGVSHQTIRRDIIELSRRNLVERYHGGAGLPTGRDRLAYANRRIRHAAEKLRIARAVARDIPNGASLFMDIGTTTEAVAEALLRHRGLRVITNHIGIAWLFCERTDFEIVLAGGMVRNRDRAILGATAAEFLEGFRVSYGIFGIGAIDEEGNLLDFDYRDVRVSRAAMAICRHRIVVADHSKFRDDAMIRLGHLRDLDSLYTDAPPPEPLRSHIERAGVRLVVAAEEEEAAPERALTPV